MNGWSYGTNHPTSATYDTAFTVNNPTRDGYTFSWWKITWMDSVTHTYGSSTTTATSISSTKETSFKNLHSTSGSTVIFEAQWIDDIAWTGTLSTTSTLKSGTQRLTWTCTDTVWVTAVYLWTKASPTASDYKTITSATSYTTWMDVTAAWTYYLYCKDAAGNVSPATSKIYYSYEVHNMLNAVDKAEWTYNTTNYPQASTYTYIAPSGTSISMVDVYTVPQYSAAGQYKWWTTANSGSPVTTASETLNGNKTYYYWFNRTKHTLTLTKKTWIETLYYKVNGASSFASTWVSTTVSMKDGSTGYTYAEASNCYTCASTCKSTIPLYLHQ